jgi:glycosyltransferase involved in cell wall biosynthesis
VPVFSVIIPTRDRADFLLRAVSSVVAQSLSDFELLIVNDGEPISQSFVDPRIRVLNNAQRGAVWARNLGIQEMRGRYVAFLDDDDSWTDTDHLQRARQQLESECDFYFADGVMVFPDGTERAFREDATPNSLKKDNTILISAVCYKSELHKRLGQFDEALPYYWDWDWYLRVAEAKLKIFHQEKLCVNIVVHTQNMSGAENISLRRANLDLLCSKHGLGFVPLKNHTDFV